MELFKKLQMALLHFDKKEFYKHAGIAVGLVLFFVIMILYYYYSKTFELQKMLRRVNNNRQEVQLLLQKHKTVLKQKEEVNAMLDEEKSFRIKNFFDGIVQQSGLKTKLKKEEGPSEELLYKRYTEIKLSAQFSQVSTRELCELLNLIEQKARIYTKELTITKTKGASLDVSLVIATLRSQSETKSR